MPSPFPGMDPYLEDPEIWPDVHHALITAVRADLQARLPSRYRARIDVRLVIQEPEPYAYLPDVTVSEVSEPEAHYATMADPGTGITADEPVTVVASGEPIRQGFIEIRFSRGGEVVTVIEILSPSNEGRGHGRKEYLQKQQDLLESDIHLIEIDLLRGGEHTIAAPPYSLRDLTGDYWGCVHRAENGPEFEIYAAPIRQRLPRIKVPLRAPDPDVVLDLPAAFSRCYDEARYEREIDYAADPAVPLRPEDREWASALLTAAGLREANRS